MKLSLPCCAAGFLVAVTMASAATDMADKRLLPDTITLKDGTRLRGLIIKNDATQVVLQERMGERAVPKSDIRRIDDQGDENVYFADIINRSKLPPWRMVVQDLRTDDNIRTFEQIPPTTIQSGYLRNIPYISFRINKRVEMNVYGNLEDPVCLEFGIYEHGTTGARFKQIIREYMAGILASREEIAAIYALDDNGGERQVGRLRFRILPPTAPDAYGGWWISVYDPARLDKARISDTAYRKVTMPFDEVNSPSGRLRTEKEISKSREATMDDWARMAPDTRGFYRNKAGDLRLITADPGAKPE
jgi:hypothetical protein